MSRLLPGFSFTFTFTFRFAFESAARRKGRGCRLSRAQVAQRIAEPQRRREVRESMRERAEGRVQSTE